MIRDRRPQPLLALLVVLATLWLATIAYGLGWEWFCGPGSGACEMGGCRHCSPDVPGSLAGVASWIGGVVVVVGGLWSAWRLGTGRWGLRRPSPRAGMPHPRHGPE